MGERLRYRRLFGQGPDEGWACQLKPRSHFARLDQRVPEGQGTTQLLTPKGLLLKVLAFRITTNEPLEPWIC